eukprot:297425-Hanusia_phi.AAC.1
MGQVTDSHRIRVGAKFGDSHTSLIIIETSEGMLTLSSVTVSGPPPGLPVLLTGPYGGAARGPARNSVDVPRSASLNLAPGAESPGSESLCQLPLVFNILRPA